MDSIEGMRESSGQRKDHVQTPCGGKEVKRVHTSGGQRKMEEEWQKTGDVGRAETL